MLRVPGLISEEVNVVPGLSRAAAFTLAGWSADEVGGDRLEQQRARLGPRGGRGGRDDDAGAGPSLDQAGDLLVVVRADPGDIGVDDA